MAATLLLVGIVGVSPAQPPTRPPVSVLRCPRRDGGYVGQREAVAHQARDLTELISVGIYTGGAQESFSCRGTC